MPRAWFYIDGFNLYHSFKAHPRGAHARWLDLKSMCAALKSPQQELGGVTYFTALANWNKGKVERHQTYLSALRATGVQVVLGRFSEVTRTCEHCRGSYRTNEEKETDVNLSSRMITDAIRGQVDALYLVTGDSDQVPTVRAIRELASHCEVVAVFPLRRHSNELKEIASRHIQLGWHHFVRNQLANPVTLGPGRAIYCPPSWLPPPAGS